MVMFHKRLFAKSSESIQQQMIPDIGGVSVLGNVLGLKMIYDCESDDKYT